MLPEVVLVLVLVVTGSSVYKVCAVGGGRPHHHHHHHALRARGDGAQARVDEADSQWPRTADNSGCRRPTGQHAPQPEWLHWFCMISQSALKTNMLQ